MYMIYLYLFDILYIHMAVYVFLCVWVCWRKTQVQSLQGRCVLPHGIYGGLYLVY